MAHKAERVARDSGADLQIAIVAAWLVRLRMARGDLAEAGALEQERSANVDGAATAARLLHAWGSLREALGLLERPQEAAQANGRTRDLIEILSLRALALWSSNERERAVGTLAEALVLAAPEDYVRTFVDEGPPMVTLMSEVLAVRQKGRTDSLRRVPAHYERRSIPSMLASRRSGTYRAWIPRNWRFLTASGRVRRKDLHPRI